MAKYRVYVYEIIRVPVTVEAESQPEAVKKVRELGIYDPSTAFRTNSDAAWADTNQYIVWALETEALPIGYDKDGNEVGS